MYIGELDDLHDVVFQNTTFDNCKNSHDYDFMYIGGGTIVHFQMCHWINGSNKDLHFVNIPYGQLQYDGTIIFDGFGGNDKVFNIAHQAPAAPTADGEYKLKVVGGVMTWVTV